MSNSFDDIAANAGALFVIGSNLTEQHPVFGARIRQAILRRKVKMVVASPDFINIAEYAALPLYHRLNTEVALVNGLMHIILEKAGRIRPRLRNTKVALLNSKRLSTAIPPARRRNHRLDGRIALPGRRNPGHEPPHGGPVERRPSRPAAGRLNVQSLANLQLLLGNLDVLGGGVNPLRSQNNIQGACDVGATPDMLPGYQPLTDDAARQKFEAAWGSPLPAEPGLGAAEIIAAASQGRVKALYILGEDILNTSRRAPRCVAAWKPPISSSCRRSCPPRLPATRMSCCPASASPKRPAPSPTASVASRW